MRNRLSGVSLLAAAITLGVASAAAQLPKELKNLRVLPKETPPRDVVEMMKGFTNALDVRCNHCHVHSGSDPDDLATFDFASDEKSAKRAARVMMQMVQAINEEHLPRIGKERAGLVRVGCVTCHRGVAKPETLEDTLAAALAEGGVEAAKRRYQELRAQYFGRGAYDFGPESLMRLGRRLAREQKLTEAIAVLAFNLEQHPHSTMTLLTLGEAQAVAGDRAGAVASYTKLLQLEPQNAWARKRLEELQPKPAPPP